MPRRNRPRSRGVKKVLNHIELEGQEELRAAIKDLNIEAVRGAKAAIAISANEIQRGAQARVRVLSGKTRDSIVTVTRDAGLTAAIGSQYPNARFEEMGTRHKAPKPFLFPAFESVRPHYLRRLVDALNLAGEKASA